MRKLTILALVAMLAVGGSAFANSNRLDFDRVDANATFGNGNNPTTTNNDDSCDIGTAPAATLLLPVFDVDINARTDNTNFTITNVSRLPQIAHITVWTDWSFPVLDFNVFLTGYDVQSISLYDVLVNRQVNPGGPGTSSTNTTRSPRAPLGSITGAAPANNSANPNIPSANVSASSNCGGTNLPGELPPGLMEAVRSALTTGLYNPGIAGVGCGTVRVGGTHTNARGYVTIDVANACSINLPDNPDYIETELLFDNVLIGDYSQVDGDLTVGNFAQASPLVHIRAIPEGGPATLIPGTNLPYTFYDRYTVSAPTRTHDRRQPLPATFAARWIEGGTGGFNTEFKIWREGVTFGEQACDDAILNSDLPILDVVRFDERENSFGFGGTTVCSPCGPGDRPGLPEASITPSTADQFPDNAGTDLGGWMFMNLNNGGDLGYSEAGGNFAPAGSGTDVRASQNWVIVSMFAQGRYGVDFDAAWLGNGCSAAILSGDSLVVGPNGGVPVCPPTVTCVTTNGTAYTGTNTTP